MATESSKIIEQMSMIRYEPTRLLPLTMGLVEDAFDGKDILVDPSMPFPYLIEISATLTAGAIEEDQLLNMQQYPVMSEDEDSLFRHLSDKNFVNMFGSPAGCWFDILLSKEEVMANAVQVGTTGTKKLTLPRHSQIVVNNMAFTMQYPITFIVKKHGGIDVVYDGSLPSPIQTLAGNKPEWGTYWVDTKSAGRVEMIRVRTYVKQMQLTSYTYSLTGAKALKKVLPLTDQFYYVRAFSRNAGKTSWTEIKTTNSQQVFDPLDPTLLYKVIDSTLTVELPYVYFATALATADIRVDVYTFKGPVNMTMSDLAPDAYIVTWKDLDASDNLMYSAPLSLMTTISIFSTDMIAGGTNAPSFEERRKRVLDNAVGDIVIPISDAQMGTQLAELGFDSMVNQDLVTFRTYLATRAMPDSTEGLASTGIDAAVVTAKKSLTDIIPLETVINNHPRYTIQPETLYRNIDGVLRFCTDAERKAVDALRGDALVNTISDGTYLWTPLHYVLDVSEEEFEVRPYYLSAPDFDVTSFVASNDTLGLTVSSSTERTITRDKDGYVIRVKSSSNATWKALRDDQVHVQLAFIPKGESDYAYINGVQIAKNGERWYEFRIASNWDLDEEHFLTTTNFSMYEPIERDYSVPLNIGFSLIWSVSDYSVDGAESTEVDLVMGDYLLPDDAVGVYHELMYVNFGSELTGLWARSRSMIGLRKYLTYPADVLAVYKTNVYDKDPVTDRPIIEDDPDNPGSKRLKIKYKKGDPKYNADGVREIDHHKGDAVLDEHGQPVMEDERNIIRWWDVCLFDAVYRYATYAKDVEYTASVPKVLVEWINDTLGGIRADLLENTDLLFQPRNTIKYVECTVEDSELETLLTSQHLTIDLYVTKDVYNNTELRAALKAASIAQAVAGVDNPIVARSKIERAITDNLGTDIVTVELSGLGGQNKNFNVVQLNDDSSRLVIAKALEQQADGTFAIVDAIEVNFKLHSKRTA